MLPFVLNILVLLFVSFAICVNRKHIVLVHGAGHGAWCWYKVATMLESAGHNVTTLDLAASGEGDLGGLSLSVVGMERFPQKIHVAVFVTAYVISENISTIAVNQENASGPLMNTTIKTTNLLAKFLQVVVYHYHHPYLLPPTPLPVVGVARIATKEINTKHQILEDVKTEVALCAFSFLTSLLNCVNGMHFVLIHGGSHGAWCWYKVATSLKSAGHNVTTQDLGASGINPKQVQDIHSISEYYEPLIKFMDSLPSEEKVTLVGHSLGGISMSVAMERFPEKISLAIFVTAFVIGENLTYPALLQEQARRTSSLMDTKFFFFDGPNKPPTARLVGPKFMASKMYQLSPPEDLSLALSLVRPVPIYNDVELLLKETSVTKDGNGRVPKVYIISKRDNLITQDMQMWMIERTGPFAELKVIEDSDHMVMFSKPKKLSSTLLQIAHKYNP
ncbi:hypothetical protein RJT34_22335 [Clitoria ternatea]|uniref:(S)-hydroxynitrile lyase n=1 Tax=Clitoria ternatea TaxID=43366 RepID=A0AAN9IV96_CLITE